MPHFRPQDLFSNSSSSLPPIPAHSGVFLTGPLSVSSLLHLALHHLSSPLRPDAPEQRGVDSSDRARGKQPERARHVLILSPVRAALRSALVEENDLALAGDTNGRSIQRLEKVEIKYLPTTAHLSYFLTTLYTHDSPMSAYDAYVASGAKSKADPSYLPLVPTLVILHNPSEYLAEDMNQRGGIEAYASLLALFVSTFSALPSDPPLLIVHDRSAASLQLPVLPLYLHKPSRHRQQAEDDDEEMADDEVQRAGLEKAAEHFFDLCGVVEQVPGSPTSVTVDEEKLFKLTMRRSDRWVSRAGSVDVVVEYAVRVEEEDEGIVGRRIELRL